ncbi:MAG: hypothetical protein Q8942_17080 [Bacillota bacterium]|nr:hypothetical protein [Bacillota bacterium]
MFRDYNDKKSTRVVKSAKALLPLTDIKDIKLGSIKKITGQLGVSKT